MNPLLLCGFGISISVDRRKLIIYDKVKKEGLEFYPHQINHDSIIIDGHTGSITFEAIRWLMKHDINLTILNWNGNLLGITLPNEPKAGKLKIAQYRAYLDSGMRYKIASGIVRQKIVHTFNLLEELSLYYSEIDLKAAEQLFATEEHNYLSVHSARAGPTINDLMMYEGRIAAYYWDALTRVFGKLYPEFHFKGRKNKSYSWNMNASDEVNALLNYGYAVLESEVRKNINAVGLDPTIGFLHELAGSKTPLIYDIQELFRWLIDLSVIELLEERRLKKSDFIVTENFHTRLRANTAKMLIEKISLNFNRKASYRGRNCSYQSILFYNIQQLANHVSDKKKELLFAIPEIKIERRDILPIRTKILTMSPAERKKLGISKSGLWYQKKNLSQGKRVRIYNKVLTKIKV